jgi:capsular exopolysaccharide synthesis family protein
VTPPDRQLTRSSEYTDVEVVDDYGGGGGAGQGGGSGFNPKKILLALRRFWWIPLITTLLGVGAGLLAAKYTPETYVSRATLGEVVKLKLKDVGLFAEDVQTFLGTQAELLKSAALRDLALERLRISRTNVTIPTGPDGKPVPVEIQMRQVPKSAVYVITANGPNPSYTQTFLDALIHAYTDYKRDIRKTVSGDTLASIAQQVEAADLNLKETQDVFSRYQRTNNLAILQQEGMVAGTYLAQLRTRLADLELEAKLLAIASSETNASPAGSLSGPDGAELSVGWLQPSPTTGSSISGVVPPEVQGGMRELETLKAQRARLSRFLRPKHPKMVKLAGDIERVEGLLNILQRQNQEQLAGARKSVLLRIENVQALIQQWQSKVMESNAKIAEAEQLRLQVNRAQLVYERLVMMAQDVVINRKIDQDSLSIIEAATPATRSYTKQLSAGGTASFGGLALGLLILVLLAFLDDGFHSQTDLNASLGALLVGQVPELEAPAKDSPLPVLAMDDSRHVFAESYRSLRSALFYLSTDLPRPAVVLITSAVPGEGKSTISVNLARTLAFGGSKVLLIDADLRRGKLHSVLGAPREPGLSDVLRKLELLESGIFENGVANLAFLATGTPVPNPGDLLLDARFGQLLAKLKQRFDYVLIDSCPVFAAADAATIGAQVDGTLFIVRRGYSKSKVVREAIETLQQRQARVLGVVFNRANASLKSYHYYKYAEYYRGETDSGKSA